MIKRLFVALTVSATLAGCSTTHQSTHVPAVGDISSSQLSAQYPSFNAQQNVLSQQQRQQIAQWPNDLSITVYFGTWCHDSQREVPRLLAIAEQANIRVKLIALDYQKSEPLGREVVAQVKYTPTFIVYQNNKELGRVIERPTTSLFDDIQSFIH